MSQLPSLYSDICPHCGGLNPTAESLPNNFSQRVTTEMNRIIKEVYKGKIKAGDIDANLYKLVGQTLEKATLQGFGKDFATVDWNTPDGEMLTRLTRDTWQFSAAKNYQQLRDTTLALVDENGKARSFADFKDEAHKINGKYNDTWLKTEYNQAIASSTMAARWANFQADADIMPYLQYDTVGDNNVRSEHQLLDGTVRKFDDEFWKQYFPPNGWGCRCSALQLTSSSATETTEVPKVPIPQMFKTNLAESGLVYPQGHPYYDGVPTKILNDYAATLPDSVAYKSVYINEEAGGSVKMHMLHGKHNPSEIFFNTSQAEYLADAGYKVKLLPDFGNAPDSVRKTFFKKTAFKAGKNPDAMVNNRAFEFKHPNGNENGIHKALKAGGKQADNTLVWLTDTMSTNDIEKCARGQMKQSKSVKEAWFFTNEKELLKYKRKDLGLD